MYYTETLLCDPVLRHGWDGMLSCRKFCDNLIILHLAQQFICGLLQFNKTEPLLAEVFD